MSDNSDATLYSRDPAWLYYSFYDSIRFYAICPKGLVYAVGAP